MIVVPSVAIKEGVYKSLQITEEHFKGLYAGVPFDYFLYDSAKLGQVRNFATSPQIQIMVVTVGAINKKDVNNLYKDSEKTGGEKPIDLIKATRPIVIVDEPQSVDGGLTGAGKTALDAMNPLCTLRYSATHVDKHHMVYRLDAVDAYERRLVKQIEVASATVEDAHNKPYVRLVSVSNRRGSITRARSSWTCRPPAACSARKSRCRTATIWSRPPAARSTPTAASARFASRKGNEFMELRVPGGEQFLKPGQAWGDVDALAVQREMIRRTIREHLDKEKRLRPQGIKVLSLFFIDEVERVPPVRRRRQRREGRLRPDLRGGVPAGWPSSRTTDTLFKEVDLTRAAEEVHNGYFSIDKKGGWTDTDGEQPGQPRQRRARLQPDHEGQGEAALASRRRSSSSSPTPRCGKAGTTRTSSRSAPCATSRPSASAGRPSAAACACASTRTASACAASR